MPWTDGAPAVRVRFHCFFSCSSKSERPTARRAAEEEHVATACRGRGRPSSRGARRGWRNRPGASSSSRRPRALRRVRRGVAQNTPRASPRGGAHPRRGPRPPREGTACAGERADGDTEEAASALDGAERALEAMRLLGAELEDEAGDAEAAIGSGSLRRTPPSRPRAATRPCPPHARAAAAMRPRCGSARASSRPPPEPDSPLLFGAGG